MLVPLDVPPPIFRTLVCQKLTFFRDVADVFLLAFCVGLGCGAMTTLPRQYQKFFFFSFLSPFSFF